MKTGKPAAERIARSRRNWQEIKVGVERGRAST
jgi:hypothetical protein